MNKPTIVIGTANEAKIVEVKHIFSDLPVDWEPHSETDLGIYIQEAADTYEANAIEKANAFANATGKPAIAGDSGMEIPALNNWPGLHSRRLDGDSRKTDEEIIAAMKDKIATIPVEDRAFRFVAVWAFALPHGPVVTGRGELHGTVSWKLHPNERLGFPYRRFWFIPQFDKFFNDLTPEEYNQIEHNKLGLDKLRPAINAYIKENHA